MNEVPCSAEALVVVKQKGASLSKRFPDIVFPKGNARVNNCGKRVLLEELKSSLDADPNGHVVFVGHTSADEKGSADLGLSVGGGGEPSSAPERRFAWASRRLISRSAMRVRPTTTSTSSRISVNRRPEKYGATSSSKPTARRRTGASRCGSYRPAALHPRQRRGARAL